MDTLVETWNVIAEVWWDWTLTSTWQGLLLLAAVAICVLTFRTIRPEVRYTLYLLVLLKLALPPLLGIPYGFSDLLSRAAMNDERAVPQYESTVALTESVAAGTAVAPLPASSPETPAPAVSWMAWLFLLEVLGASVMLYILAKQTYSAWLIARHSNGNDPLHLRLESLARAMQLRWAPRLVVSERIDSPRTGGAVRPFIAVPPWVCALPVAEQDILLAHELVHVRRRDALVNTLQALVQALLWWNPIVWWLNRAIREEREICCDDRVIASGMASGSTYSKLLVEVAERVSCRQPQWVMAGMADGFRKIDRRVRRAMDDAVARRVPPAVPATMLLLVAAAWILPGSTSGQERSAGQPGPELPEGATILPVFELLESGNVTYEINSDENNPGAEGVSIAAESNSEAGPALEFSADNVLGEVKEDGSTRSVYEGNVKLHYETLEFEAERLIQDGTLEFFDVLLRTRDFGEIRSPRIKADIAARRLDILDPDMDEAKLKAAFGPDAIVTTANGWLTLPFSVVRQIDMDVLIVEVDADADLGLPEGSVLQPDEADMMALEINDGMGYLRHTPSIVVGQVEEASWSACHAKIQALAKEGRAEVVSAPKVITPEGQKARISIGSEIPYDRSGEETFQFVGTKVFVLPTLVESEDRSEVLQLLLTYLHCWETQPEGAAPSAHTFNSTAFVHTLTMEQDFGEAYCYILLPGREGRSDLVTIRATSVQPG